MMNEMDLHGMTHDEAVLVTEDFVLRKSIDPLFQCTIITGNSKPLQDRIIEDVLVKHDFKYMIPSYNQGCIIIS